jgi:hypothetical protein
MEKRSPSPVYFTYPQKRSKNETQNCIRFADGNHYDGADLLYPDGYKRGIPAHICFDLVEIVGNCVFGRCSHHYTNGAESGEMGVEDALKRGGAFFWERIPSCDLHCFQKEQVVSLLSICNFFS